MNQKSNKSVENFYAQIVISVPFFDIPEIFMKSIKEINLTLSCSCVQ